MKHFLKILCIFAIATAVGSGTAHAIDGSRGGSFLGLRLFRAWLDLDVASDQKTELASIVRSEREKLRPQADALIEARKQLSAAVLNEQFNEQRVRDAAKAVAAAEEEFAVGRARLASEALAVLTPEQKTKIESLRVEITERIEGRIAEVRSLIDAWVESNAG